MLHVICNVVGIVQYHILNSNTAAIYFQLCQNLKFILVDLHLKTVCKLRGKYRQLVLKSYTENNKLVNIAQVLILNLYHKNNF